MSENEIKDIEGIPFRVCAFQVKFEGAKNGFWNKPKVRVRCALTTKGGLDAYPYCICMPKLCPLYPTWKKENEK